MSALGWVHFDPLRKRRGNTGESWEGAAVQQSASDEVVGRDTKNEDSSVYQM